MLKNNVGSLITKEMLANYHELNLKKKEIETELNELKKAFNQYFDMAVGKDTRGDIAIGDYKLQRQVRVTEKYEQEDTVNRLEKLNFLDLIQKKPDEEKIKAALNLGLLKESDLVGCIKASSSLAIYVKRVE
ncbi:hypothetical protein ACFFHH_04540 [Cytobacillus solani]|uniref:Uncharacterized protein n=1 Tax=Cytobacillus solani TaxID=1637975 RepID=A0A0Q3T371_9BACI|nr:hypothetical protein [Cytobacillus solani]KQL17877.1 hypothetical protein AN957_04150 [Cytobacillus solani]USK55698.1 hypothetical protein LIS82_03965 [Cytobacillus solani]